MSLPFLSAAIRVAWHRHRLTCALEGLNDHCLRDMGLERGMIDEYVVAAFPWPATKASARRRIVLSLKGCG